MVITWCSEFYIGLVLRMCKSLKNVDEIWCWMHPVSSVMPAIANDHILLLGRYITSWIIYGTISVKYVGCLAVILNF